MTEELFNALEALGMMWDQYCNSEWGHMCMSAGETAEEILDKYDLLIHTGGYKAHVNEEKLEEYRQLVIKQRQQDDTTA